ncbi:MAG: SDR family NAD(P)-dependent oxidoreductase, partial [Actinobacteria bacterium]|nr:SDR family NAD(P)-dependent oxidoreductase [Actinomycetota bacterium]
MDAFDLSGRVAWVTGASRGLGRAAASALAQAGATVALTARSADDLAEVEKELVAGGADAYAVPGSIAVPDEVDRATATVLERSGRLDIAFLGAAISPIFKRAEHITGDEWRSIIDINMTGTWYCCQAAGRIMLEAGTGSIINVTSVSGVVGTERLAPYAAAKGGLEILTRCLALEWGQRGVRVNALAPGFFAAGVGEPLIESRWGDWLLAKIPTGRFGQVEDLDGAVVF